MTDKYLTCVVCPAGCKIKVAFDENGKIITVDGNTCVRGKNYAVSEVTHPVRTLTSTVPVMTKSGWRMLPVRTDNPIPRESLFDAMSLVRAVKVTAPVSVGDVIIRDFVEPGVNLIACKDFE